MLAALVLPHSVLAEDDTAAMQSQVVKAQHTLTFWENHPGKLFRGFEKCWQIKGQRAREVCTIARASKRLNEARVALIKKTHPWLFMPQYVIDYWMQVHVWEQGSGWGMVNSNYPGGLGISPGGWNWWAGDLGLLDRFPNGAVAPVLAQIYVADYGWRCCHGNWTSMASHHYPY